MGKRKQISLQNQMSWDEIAKGLQDVHCNAPEVTRAKKPPHSVPLFIDDVDVTLPASRLRMLSRGLSHA